MSGTYIWIWVKTYGTIIGGGLTAIKINYFDVSQCTGVVTHSHIIGSIINRYG
jgi:hypothetical protein